MSQLLAAVMNSVFAIGTWFTPATIERFGRRPILLWSAGACTILMTIFVAMIGQEHKTLATQWTAVSSLYWLCGGWTLPRKADVVLPNRLQLSLPSTYSSVGDGLVSLGFMYVTISPNITFIFDITDSTI